ncbi:MAG: ABC transporter ATP-binding protein [Spirochaetes bacterium]|nr:ABC transporter ATP-binding protein [Spirochaetota bacterium]
MNNKQIEIRTEAVEKRFGKTLLFRNIDIQLKNGDSFYITGPNGSGKSTLLQILAGIQRPSSGSVTYTVNNSILKNDYYKDFFGFTGPQVNPYDMLTAVENLKFMASESIDNNKIFEFLEKFDLYRHKDKAVKYYSSGMKQRLRIIHALIHDPEILMLDEPCSNLDTKGCHIVYQTINDLKADKILIIATNESDDINLCSKGINLEQQNIK